MAIEAQDNNALNSISSYLEIQEQFSLPPSEIDGTKLENLIESFANDRFRSENNLAEIWIPEFYNFSAKVYSSHPQLIVSCLEPISRFSWKFVHDSTYKEMGRTMNYLGLAMRKMQRTDDELAIFNMSIEYFKQFKDLDKSILPSLYNNISRTYDGLGDYAKALDYVKEAERLSEQLMVDFEHDESQKQVIGDRLSSMKLNKGIFLHRISNRQAALQAYLEALDLASIYKESLLGSIYGNLGVSYEFEKSYEESEKYYKLAIHEAELNNNTSSFYLQSVNLLSIYSKTLQIKEFNYAAKRLREKLQISINLPEYRRLLGLTYIQEARMMEISQDNTLAFRHLINALEIIDPDLKSWDPASSLPSDGILEYPFLIVEILNSLSRVNKEIASAENHLPTLIRSLSFLTNAETIIGEQRSTLSSQESKIILNEHQRKTYSAMADLCKNLFDMTGERLYLEQMFSTIEKGKTAGLWSEIQQSDLKADYIPKNLLDQETLYKSNIAQTQNDIISLSRSGIEDRQEKLRKLQEIKFEWTTKLDSIVQIYSDSFPDYHKLKFNNDVLSLNELQRLLKAHQLFIQYYFSNNYLHQLLITQDSVVYRSIDNPGLIRDNSELLIQHLKQRRHDYNRNEVSEYFQLSKSLYDMLFAEVQNELRDNDLIISADAILNLIPFEALVRNDSIDKNDDFRNFDYLIYNHRLSYTYTATLWAYHTIEKNTTKTSGQVLAFAPMYEKNKDVNYYELYGESLSVLPGTLDEIDFISKNFRSKTFIKKKATEENFKTEINTADILHLAMHTVIDNDVPLQSFLVFDNRDDTTEDGKMTASEILNYRINARLAVLSACNTGSGEIRRGEGIMGLARSFIQAGCPNLVLNLWAMDDNYGKEIVNDFYLELKNGKTLSESLQQAKITHLRNAKKLDSHPHYWAGVVLLGKDTELDLPEKRNYLWTIAIIIIAMGLLIGIQLRKK